MFLEERESGKAWRLHRDRIYKLGRNPDRDIRFDVAHVSRLHAELFWDGKTWRLRDCNSIHGTYIQEQKIQEQQLYPHQWFRLGQESGVVLRLLPQLETVTESEFYYPEPSAEEAFAWDNFQGHPETRNQLVEYSHLILDADLNQPVQGILLLGGKGRGIRFLCRCLAERLGSEGEQEFNFLSRDLGEANNLYQASKLIHKSLKKCSKNVPAVILLQNFDVFYRYLQKAQDFEGTNTGQTTWWNRFWGKLGIADLASETEKARQLKEKLASNLATYWQWNSDPKHKQKKIIIIATAGNLAHLPPEVQKPGEVFSFVLPVPQATLAGRVAVLNKYLHQAGTPLDRQLNLNVLSEKLGRINSHQIEQVVRGAEELRYKAGADCLAWEHFESFLPPSSAAIWQSVFLKETILESMQQWAESLRGWELSNPDLPEVPQGIVLTGASGTGKTAVAKLLAQDGNCELISVTPGKIKSPLVGQSVQNLQAVFADAKRQAPAIILFDEIESILPRREEQLGDPTTVEVINQFLQEFDRLSLSTGVIIVGTSNRPEQIDPAVLSRLATRIELPLPTVEQRSKMLEYFLTQQTRVVKLGVDVDLSYYAQLLVGKSGRDIKAIASRIIAQLDDSSLVLRKQDLDTVLIPKITGELTGVILPPSLIAELTRTLAQFLQAFANPQLTPPAGLLLSGFPGTGKTEIARAMARLGGIQFQEVSAEQIRDKYVGESNRKLSRLFAQARRNAPTILFFDEIDGLFPSRDRQSVQHEIELVNQFLQEVDGVANSGRGIFIVGATNRVDKVDAAVRSRLAKTITIPLPALSERIKLLQLFVGDRPVADNLDWRAIALLLSGKSGRAIKAKVEETYHLACQDRADTTGELSIEHFQQAVLWTGDNNNIPDLVLPPVIMSRVEQTLATLKNLPQALSLGLPLPKGMLLTGAPGTGKTQIARYLAAKAGWFFRAISPSEVKSTYQGGSLQNLQAIFTDARDRSPCILFFDEIDSLFPRRDTGNNPEVELVNEFLQQVDGAAQSAAGIFLLGATNRADTVDPAVISRLQQTLEVPLPGVRERQIMLEHALGEKEWQLAADVELRAIARLLEGRSGRDIQGLLTKVGQAYIQRQGWLTKQVILNREDFEKSLLPSVEIDESAWSELILSPELKQSLQQILERFLRFFRDPIPGVTPAQGMLLYGAPGTGKTQVARVLAQAAGCRFIDLSIAEMRSQYVGEASKKLAQTFERARREAPTILFIDEIDALFPQRESNVSQYEVELINQLLQELDGFRGGAMGVFVIGATNYVERVDNAVRSRLNKVLEIPLPAQPERIAMLRLFTKEMQIDPNLDWSKVGRLLEGKSGRDIRQLVSEVGQYASDRLLPDRSLEINLEHFQALIQSQAPQGELTWNDIVLPTPITEELKRLVKLVANYTNLPPGINPPKGALLYGEPGTGKTQIARVIASVGRMYFKSYAPADIRSKWVGQSSRNLADVFNQARQQSPAILFFDEMESLFPNRGGMGSGDADLENQNLVNQFLQEVDGIQTQGSYVFVLGATNYIENIDPAVRSRLQKKIAIPLPGVAEIEEMLKRKIHPDWILAEDVNLSAYVNSLVGRSGRDIATGVETAAQLAFDQWTEGSLLLRDRHFCQGLELADIIIQD